MKTTHKNKLLSGLDIINPMPRIRIRVLVLLYVLYSPIRVLPQQNISYVPLYNCILYYNFSLNLEQNNLTHFGGIVNLVHLKVRGYLLCYLQFCLSLSVVLLSCYLKNVVSSLCLNPAFTMIFVEKTIEISAHMEY